MAQGRDHDWRAGDGVVVRTPLLPLTLFADWSPPGADASREVVACRKVLADLLALPEIDEALFVASPSLHGQLAAWREKPESTAGQRLENSLVKYVARMAGRSTPFGLFSGVSSGTLGKETRIQLAPRSEYRRRTRLDNDYLFVLADVLVKTPEIRERLTLRPNSSIYRIAGRLRYAAARLEDKDRGYHLVSVEPTPYLDATLERAATGARLADLAAPLVDDEITLDEARGYINELIDAQLLVPDLGIHVTGPEPIDGMLAQLAAAGPDPAIDQARAKLDEARAAIAAIDAAGVGNSPDKYRAIAATLETLPAKVDLSLLFQVDMVKPSQLTVGKNVAAELAKTVASLARLSKASEAQSLEEFRSQFRERWEDQEIPLVEALDEESGIGFERARGPGSEGAPLLARLGFPGAAGEARMPIRAIDRFLLRKLATAPDAEELVLEPKDIDAYALSQPARLPDAFAVMVRMAGTPEEAAKGNVTLLYEGTSGPSGARLLGRFCHASPDIDAIVRAHHAAEEALRPDAIFAEIVHLNEGRIGNILCRPVLRAHEIVFLGVSGAPRDQQIQLDDLLVAVRGDRIVLRSRRLGKEIVPRLTTAHNYRLRSLGVYRFLCALAGQGCEHPMWTWGSLDGAPYLPRVRLGKVVLARRTWNLDTSDLAGVTTAVRETQKGKVPPAERRERIAAAVAELRRAKKLPRYLMIAAGDNELPIDLDNPLLASAFADEISGMPRVELVEMFPAPDQLIATGPEGRFANELVFTYTRSPQQDKAKPSDKPRSVASQPSAIRRSFTPGSEWLFAKIYCGESTGDRVLREAIAPLVREAMAAGDIDHWFFIRYSDPDPHIRVRFHGDPARLAGAVLPALDRAVQPLLTSGAARKVVLDTYNRETERYGGDRGIELVERIFHHDSEAVLSIVELLDGDAGGDARWRLALRGIDSLLDTVGLAADVRARIVANGRDMIGREFNADTAFWGRIGDRFTAERASLDVLFARDPARDAGHDLEPGFELLAKRDAALAPIVDELKKRDAAGELSPTIEEMGWSLVHMHANRLLHASQRAQELVLYDFLRRLHQSQKARAKQQS